MARGPLRLVEAPAPVPVRGASGEQCGAVALERDAAPQRVVVVAEEIASGLVPDRDVARVQPLQHGIRHVTPCARLLDAVGVIMPDAPRRRVRHGPIALPPWWVRGTLWR